MRALLRRHFPDFDWRAARRLPDARGRGAPGPVVIPAALGSRGRGLHLAEHSDAANGIFSDQGTEMAARALFSDARRLRNRAVCDVGCGTGILSVLAARLGAARSVGIDCDPRALALARRTAAANGADVSLHRGDLLTGVRGRFDILVANLPQKPAPGRARLGLGQNGGARGDALLMRFIPQAARRLAPGGRLYLFLHTLAPRSIAKQLAKNFHVEVLFWRRRLVPPGEYPAALLSAWLALAARGEAIFLPLAGRRGWHVFYALQLACRRI